MTRNEQIDIASLDWWLNKVNQSGDAEMAFKAGASWADAHPSWISVEDELPEENKWVLTYNGSSINLLMLAGNGNWYDHGVAQHRNVTHWKRIEPPAKLSSLERNGKNWKE